MWFNDDKVVEKMVDYGERCLTGIIAVGLLFGVLVLLPLIAALAIISIPLFLIGWGVEVMLDKILDSMDDDGEFYVEPTSEGEEKKDAQ